MQKRADLHKNRAPVQLHIQNKTHVPWHLPTQLFPFPGLCWVTPAWSHGSASADSAMETRLHSKVRRLLRTGPPEGKGPLLSWEPGRYNILLYTLLTQTTLHILRELTDLKNQIKWNWKTSRALSVQFLHQHQRIHFTPILQSVKTLCARVCAQNVYDNVYVFIYTGHIGILSSHLSYRRKWDELMVWTDSQCWRSKRKEWWNIKTRIVMLWCTLRARVTIF